MLRLTRLFLLSVVLDCAILTALQFADQSRVQIGWRSRVFSRVWSVLHSSEPPIHSFTHETSTSFSYAECGATPRTPLGLPSVAESKVSLFCVDLASLDARILLGTPSGEKWRSKLRSLPPVPLRGRDCCMVVGSTFFVPQNVLPPPRGTTSHVRSSPSSFLRCPIRSLFPSFVARHLSPPSPLSFQSSSLRSSSCNSKGLYGVRCRATQSHGASLHVAFGQFFLQSSVFGQLKGELLTNSHN